MVLDQPEESLKLISLTQEDSKYSPAIKEIS